MPEGSDKAAVQKQFIALTRDVELHKTSKEILLHLAISLFVAAFLLFLVEIRVKKLSELEAEEFQSGIQERLDPWTDEQRTTLASARSAISEDVWKAVWKNAVPQEVREALTRILRTQIIRRDAVYTLTIKRLPPYSANLQIHRSLSDVKPRIRLSIWTRAKMRH
jgi:AcrR family transcriptional regulator